jgi:hypothetical protein
MIATQIAIFRSFKIFSTVSPRIHRDVEAIDFVYAVVPAKEHND